MGGFIDGSVYFFFSFHTNVHPSRAALSAKKEDGEPRKVSGQRGGVAHQRAADEQRGGDQRGAELEDDILNETGHVVPNVVLNAQIGFAL